MAAVAGAREAVARRRQREAERLRKKQEQHKVSHASRAAKLALAEGNRVYERTFQRTFIVCAEGKSPEEILEILQRRLSNDHATELRETVEQQWQITSIRLRWWLQG